MGQMVLFDDGGKLYAYTYPDDYASWQRAGRTLADYLTCHCDQPDCWVPVVVAVLPDDAHRGDCDDLCNGDWCQCPCHQEGVS
jgi:hypothetical protein